MFDFQADPVGNFEELLKNATIKKIAEPTAMSLATIGLNQKPSVRIVYFKGMVRGGFSFFCNYNSEKGRSIELHSQVCLNFYWPELWQQVRINGCVEKLSRNESEAYFATRPRLSQIGAWASNQSAEIPSYEFFAAELDKYTLKFEGHEVPCPPHWGGYRIEPERFEFWFGLTGRLHERYVYTKEGSSWNRSLLAP